MVTRTVAGNWGWKCLAKNVRAWTPPADVPTARMSRLAMHSPPPPIASTENDPRYRTVPKFDQLVGGRLTINDDGMVRPSVLAVRILMNSSSFGYWPLSER